MASSAAQTVVLTPATPDDDPVRYVRARFQSALGRAPDAAAHYYWSRRLLDKLGAAKDAALKAEIEEQFKGPEVDVQLAGFTYIGHDDEFAVARVKLKSTGKPDSGFVDNTVDSIMIFHYQDGAWKIWTEKVLGVDAGEAK